MRVKILLLLFLISSCSLLRKVDKDNSQTTATEQIITKSTRRGDTVNYEIPIVRYKDTTIVTYNRVGTRLETTFDTEGNVDHVRCLESAINDLKIENREFKEMLDKKSTEKEVKTLNWTWIAIAAIFVIGLLAWKKI